MIAYDFSDFSQKNHVTYFPAITKRKDIENSENRLIITVIDLHVHTEFESRMRVSYFLIVGFDTTVAYSM